MLKAVSLLQSNLYVQSNANTLMIITGKTKGNVMAFMGGNVDSLLQLNMPI